ncbi:Uncharacterised protein [Legionella donaldsonii]|uniref:V8-like Glu-specific endopeptidase n=1 Tax=Legionella donaldsonii TaxID=45060 RepID=A0A378J091_9GAMM|nr:serine protease [Legionella donaldsonii]STX41132.1 Uncharacterised protein [Legionella donaldsonii]
MVINVNPFSAASLFIDLSFDGAHLASATSFLVKRNNTFFVLTNRHNVTGRDQNTREPLDKKSAGIPNMLTIHFNSADKQGEYIGCVYPLFEDFPVWYEHPILREKGDFVALKPPIDEAISLSPYYDLDKWDNDILFQPGCRLNIIGFPYGRASTNNLGIWITGFLASDLDVDIDGQPKFYIDARTRTGQSGSPVVFFRHNETISLKNGSRTSASCTYLMGIYSGRIGKDSDIGIVWKLKALRELIDSIPID